MRLYSLPLLIYGSLSCVGVGAQGTRKNVLTSQMDAFIDGVLKDWNSPGGAAVAVVQMDEQGVWNVETKGYGVATATGKKVSELTQFSIGSNSKLFTVLATGLLIHNETLSPRISWSSKIASLIPFWDLMDPVAAKQATILDLMSHRTGLPRHDSSSQKSDDVPTFIKKLKYQRPSAEFRETLQYTNSMYTVLSYLPTLLLNSDIPFARYVKRNIFDPLGMNFTTYSYETARATGNLADGMLRYGVNVSENPFGNGTVRYPPYWSTRGNEDGNPESGEGGIISNAVDMATWLQTLLLGGVKPGTNQSVIPPGAIEKAAEGIMVYFGTGAAIFPELSPTVYGGGQIRGTYRGHELIEHSGSVLGYNSAIARLPFDNVGVAVLTNDFTYGSYFAEIIKYGLLDQALGLELVDWNSRFKMLASFPPEPPMQCRADASPSSVPFLELAGTYDNPGYGSFELCIASSKNPPGSEFCQAFMSNISEILPGAINPGIPTLLADFNGVGSSYLRLTHYNGNTFNVTGMNSYATGNPAEPYWIYGDLPPLNTVAHAEVGVDNGRIGIGLTGVWEAGFGIQSPSGTSARERAEVWFEKL
ncbi:beta-lactamase/transpeptidase-like protein [Collybia nuda]|uniref:Beta-lactamase/transpeptidase-like protein n=1 Tax=Collybia nuda TaxID=64659 RepID=A0A9P6CFC0_9AGAR|nr:beta-lactamase/transpeptidase-like protein [Collybia nuda]